MGAKRTHELIPFCHLLGLESCKFSMDVDRGRSEVRIRCTVRVTGKTGVEMEALTGASVAALAVYDMCKAASHEIEILRTRLLHKSGDFLPDALQPCRGLDLLQLSLNLGRR
jgi:cyclic pyranopterin phosphate synthase